MLLFEQPVPRQKPGFHVVSIASPRLTDNYPGFASVSSAVIPLLNMLWSLAAPDVGGFA